MFWKYAESPFVYSVKNSPDVSHFDKTSQIEIGEFHNKSHSIKHILKLT